MSALDRLVEYTDPETGILGHAVPWYVRSIVEPTADEPGYLIMAGGERFAFEESAAEIATRLLACQVPVGEESVEGA
jgi:hypothetical protein